MFAVYVIACVLWKQEDKMQQNNKDYNKMMLMLPLNLTTHVFL